MVQPTENPNFAPTVEAARPTREAAHKSLRLVQDEAKRVAALAEELKAYWPSQGAQL